MEKNTRNKGNHYEAKAASYLRECGFRILDRNFKCKMGEIDIIAQKGPVVHFVEIKFRSSRTYGTPMEAVDYRKRRRISNAASYFLYCNRWRTDTPVSFDVIALSAASLELFENAYEYCGKY